MTKEELAVIIKSLRENTPEDTHIALSGTGEDVECMTSGAGLELLAADLLETSSKLVEEPDLEVTIGYQSGELLF